MSDFKRNIVPRFGIVYFIMVLLFGVIIAKIVVIQTKERSHWLALMPNQKKATQVVPPNRGNIYAYDNRLMASSIPHYFIYMDTRVEALHVHDGKLFHAQIDSVSHALANYFKDRSPQDYKRLITKGYMKGESRLLIYPKRIDYMQLHDVMKMPLFRLGRIKSGLMPEERYERVRPYGSLAQRTIGDIYGDDSKGGRAGLEKYFNKELCGVPGLATSMRVANRWAQVIDVEPQDGNDIVSTIDIDLQDIAEHALRETLLNSQADWGCVVLMETATGEVRACANLNRRSDGSYQEDYNYAVMRVEPGSTFKTAALMAAIDDGKVNIHDTVDTRNGTWVYTDSRHPITDWNAHTGGFGKITVQNALEASSNVGLARVTVNAYAEKPQNFIDKLESMGLMESVPLEVPGAGVPSITLPKQRETLTRMAYGYSVDIPPIYTLMFYNAIANNGKMIHPFFAKEIRQNGDPIKTFSTHTVRGSICSSSTLEQIRTCLQGVVWSEKFATAKAARSSKVHIAGKTGTARLLENGRYENERHRISFCGYFPMEKPLYSCICVVHNPRIGAHSGGSVCGAVVRQIAERAMAAKLWRTPKQMAADTAFHYVLPSVKNGKGEALHVASQELGLRVNGNLDQWMHVWERNDSLCATPISERKYMVPNVMGMGAKDAVYLIERSGMQARVQGKGRVVSQSLPAGQTAMRGGIMVINLR